MPMLGSRAERGTQKLPPTLLDELTRRKKERRETWKGGRWTTAGYFVYAKGEAVIGGHDWKKKHKHIMSISSAAVREFATKEA